MDITITTQALNVKGKFMIDAIQTVVGLIAGLAMAMFLVLNTIYLFTGV